ncbi:hypothetical protein FQR65_LT18038 [Abscondita terminalis]|nr:hypothetical protein FQR65_LT18038 [Abscondita terminalis]
MLWAVFTASTNKTLKVERPPAAFKARVSRSSRVAEPGRETENEAKTLAAANPEIPWRPPLKSWRHSIPGRGQGVGAVAEAAK